MFVDGLQDAEGPAEALAHEAVGVGGRFGEGEGHVFVFDAVAEAQQGHGEVGVFGDGIDVVAAGFADGGDAPCADGSGDDADGAENVEGAAFKILAGDVFEGLPAGPEIHAVADFGVAGHGSDFGIDEVRDEAGDGVWSDDGVGVDADENFGVLNVLDAVVQGFGFAGVVFAEDDDLPGGLFFGEGGVGDFERAIF